MIYDTSRCRQLACLAATLLLHLGRLKTTTWGHEVWTSDVGFWKSCLERPNQIGRFCSEVGDLRICRTLEMSDTGLEQEPCTAERFVMRSSALAILAFPSLPQLLHYHLCSTFMLCISSLAHGQTETLNIQSTPSSPSPRSDRSSRYPTNTLLTGICTREPVSIASFL